MPFTAIDPCRVVDTRVGSGFAGEWGPPALATTLTRTFTVGGQCGIPVSAQAVSFQFTAVNMTSNGNFRAWPGGGSMPTASVLNWTASQGVAGNGIVVPIGGGDLNVYVNGPAWNTVDLVLDVNGYYAVEERSFSHLLAVGTVASDGSSSAFYTNLGTWTSAREGEGLYRITFSGLRPGCTGLLPTTLLDLYRSGFIYVAALSTFCATGDVVFSINTRSTANVALDAQFSFLVYGPSPVATPLTSAIGRRIPSTCRFTTSTGVETCE